ncbi:MAG: outer membrane protein assembly factor BamD [Nitrosomonadaceae bacterium]
MSTISRSLVVFLALLLSGCAFGWLKTYKKGENTAGWPVTQYYSEAKNDLENGDYKGAIAMFIALEARYPYGRYAQQAQLEVAYAHYKEDDGAAAVIAANRFIKLHPNHPNVDYAYYIKGMASFNVGKGWQGYMMREWINQKMSERDPKMSRESFESFKDLVTRFPNSKYRHDVLKRMNHLRNKVAMGEIYVARYYMKRGAYVAAVNRAQFVIEEYPQTPATEEALSVMMESYDELGMTDLRDDAERVMKKNFPDNMVTPDLVTSENESWWKFW